MQKILLTYFLLQLFLVNFAQNKTFNNWHFGSYAGLTFNSNPPSTFPSSNLNTKEGCSSISDTSGNTLFYTDGIVVFNKMNFAMPNGYGLQGHESSTQSALIIPKPYNQNQYYIFTTDAQAGSFPGSAGCGCLSYSIVDMTLNSGMGDVVSKNILLHNSMTEKITGCIHKNDSCIWLVAHEWNSNNFLSYLITPTGINTTPVISSVGSSHCCDPNNENAIGQMKISTDGTKLGYVMKTDRKVEFFNFNNSTGIVSNPISITLPPGTGGTNVPYGFEFSPNSSLAYVTTSLDFILQFNLSTWTLAGINTSMTQVQGATGLGGYTAQLQLGPDDKIYVSYYGDVTMGVINNPDVSGSGCNYINNQLIIYYCYLGLPNAIPSLFKRKKSTTDLCNSDPVIPNVITPNNDGINDIFKISCENFSFIPSDLQIYNRWGKIVYESKKNNDLTKLTDGTYFYIFTDNDKTYKGYLSVFK